MSQVLDELAPFLGFIFCPSTTEVLLDEAPFFGLSSLPSQSHVLEEDAQLFGLSSRPSQIQSLGKSISELMASPPLVKSHQKYDRYNDE